MESTRTYRPKLTSWKEIACFLGREVRTVQRWEKLNGLPVRRLLHDKRGSVYAYADELEAWVESHALGPPEREPGLWSKLPKWPMYSAIALAMVALLMFLLRVFEWHARPMPRGDLAGTLHTTISSPASESYLRGLYYLNRGTADDLQESTKYFQKVLVADKDNALAYAGLSEAYLLLGIGNSDSSTKIMQASNAAERAISLSGSLAEAHEARAMVLAYGNWNWNDAEKEFQLAIHLNPNLASVHNNYAQLEGLLGRNDLAIEEAKRARELEPLSAILGADLGWYYYWARQFDTAIAVSRGVLKSEPRFSSAQNCIVRSLLAQKRYQDARIELEQQLEQPGHSSMVPGLDVLSAEQAVRNYYSWNVKKLKRIQKHQEISSFDLALGLAFLNRKEELLSCLEGALRRRNGIVLVINVEPFFDAYRRDPRFSQIAKQVGLAATGPKMFEGTKAPASSARSTSR
jgi:tetratricopeptide (TPR) repeat protein